MCGKERYKMDSCYGRFIYCFFFYFFSFKYLFFFSLDSLPREIVAYLMSFNDVLDTTKFEHADEILGENGIRVTFQTWADILVRGTGHETLGDTPRNFGFIEEIFDHYNLRSNETSDELYKYKYLLYDEKQIDSPDVFIFNAANAYSEFLQSKKVCFLSFFFHVFLIFNMFFVFRVLKNLLKMLLLFLMVFLKMEDMVMVNLQKLFGMVILIYMEHLMMELNLLLKVEMLNLLILQSMILIICFTVIFSYFFIF